MYYLVCLILPSRSFCRGNPCLVTFRTFWVVKYLNAIILILLNSSFQKPNLAVSKPNLAMSVNTFFFWIVTQFQKFTENEIQLLYILNLFNPFSMWPIIFSNSTNDNVNNSIPKRKFTTNENLVYLFIVMERRHHVSQLPKILFIASVLLIFDEIWNEKMWLNYVEIACFYLKSSYTHIHSTLASPNQPSP